MTDDDDYLWVCGFAAAVTAALVSLALWLLYELAR